MLYDDKDVSPLIAAQNMVPWWMIRIKDFDGLEIKPWEIIGHTFLGSKITQPCKPEYASFWTVYGRCKSGENENKIEAFEDFNTEAEARHFYDRVLQAYLPQRMIPRHPFFQRYIRKQPALILKNPAHPQISLLASTTGNHITAPKSRGFSADC